VYADLRRHLGHIVSHVRSLADFRLESSASGSEARRKFRRKEISSSECFMSRLKPRPTMQNRKNNSRSLAALGMTALGYTR
jgi:hypothetical protein